jgi:SAM-dependent methyltransferase
LEYPPNHDFDPRTLEPRGLLADRMRCLRRWAAEMFKPDFEPGGDPVTFLDVGSNKGFVCFALAMHYDTLRGIEPIETHVVFAREVAEAHELKNIDFQVAGLYSVTESADVVYAGHLNHHLYSEEVKRHERPFGFMRKLAELAKSILIVDGPFELDDATARARSVQDNWTQIQKDTFSIAGHAESIKDTFDLIRVGPSGTAKRLIAVFRRR